MQPDANGLYLINGQQCVPDFFAYTMDWNTAAGSNLAAGATSQQQFTVQAGQYFLWQQATYWADTAQATQTDSTRLIPLVTLTLTDSNSGKNLFNSAVMVPSIFGTGQLPFVLPIPRLCMPQSVITGIATNITAAVNYNLRLTFIGLALFPV